MATSNIGRRWLIGVAAAGVFGFVACAPAAPPPQQAPAVPPAPSSAKPAAPEKTSPAAPPAQPAAKPAAPQEKAAAPQPAKAAGRPAVELRAGCGNPKGDGLCDTWDKFAELVQQKTNGEVVVRVFYQSLGVEHQLMANVMTGSVDMGSISTGNASRYSTAFLIYDLPFVFKSNDAMLQSLKGSIGQKLIAQFGADAQVKPLFSYSFGSGRDVQTRKTPAKVPADIRGLKIRVVSTPVDLAIYRAWGANPTPVDWGQTYAALQQGVVDGLNANFALLETAKLYEVVKYDIRLDYQENFQQAFMNRQVSDSLAPGHQKALMAAAEEAQTWNWADMARRTKEVEDRVTKLGMTIHHPTPDEYAQWASIREDVWKQIAQSQPGKIDLDLAQQLFKAQ